MSVRHCLQTLNSSERHSWCEQSLNTFRTCLLFSAFEYSDPLARVIALCQHCQTTAIVLDKLIVR